ncbi:hypothetical protein OG429_23935 [Streptomyces sp. NBC_00190]|uniref:hypothetical protein n=1 Tax=Streptomyces sp. NBC_00190 TaxID=2903634 RepID=UPI002E27D509|nr:hypothetical protein [Streptomyces sp. NBC_00190]
MKADATFNASFGSWKSGNGNWCWNESKHVTGDFNGDGRDDMLALYGHGNGSVEMYTLLGKADGGFAAPVRSWNRAAGIWDCNRSKLTRATTTATAEPTPPSSTGSTTAARPCTP